MTNKKKIIKIVLSVVAILILLFVLLTIYNYRRIQSGELIKWKGEFYTKEEFKKIIPPQNYHVDAKNTPEEVYTGFRQAILNDDVEGALGFIVEKNRDEYREVFEDENSLDMYKELPVVDKIKEDKGYSYENIVGYSYKKTEDSEEDMPYSVHFIKTREGYWKIENI